MSTIKSLRNCSFLRPLFYVRDKIMDKLGLFILKKRIKYFFFLRHLVREDSKKKKVIAQKIQDIPTNYLPRDFSENDFVFSLTSYGNRVHDSLPFALYSLITQTVLPHKVVVYLDKDNWNNQNLPFLLKELQRIGVCFSFCDDLLSYKKLLPALRQFPNNPIVTFDDDFYYHPNYHEWMLEAYQKSDKITVLGNWGCIPEKNEGKYLPYNQWKDCKYGNDDSPISFYGGSGTCYPPHIFDDEIFNQTVFLRLCPKADDIWFWIMEERLGIKRKYISHRGYGYHISVDRVYDYRIGADGCLTLSNVINGENDMQLSNLLDYYGLE